MIKKNYQGKGVKQLLAMVAFRDKRIILKNEDKVGQNYKTNHFLGLDIH